MRLPGSGHPVFSSPNVINLAYISSIARAILTHYIPPFNTKAPVVNANGSVSYYYKASPPNIDNRNTYGLRGDWTLNAKHSILGRYLYAHQYLFGPVTPSNFAPSGNLQLITTEDALVSDTWTLNDHSVNVARYGWQAIRGEPNKTSGVSLNSVGFGYSASNAEAAGLPYVAVANYFTQGDAQQPFARRGNHVDTFSDAKYGATASTCSISIVRMETSPLAAAPAMPHRTLAITPRTFSSAIQLNFSRVPATRLSMARPGPTRSTRRMSFASRAIWFCNTAFAMK